MKKVTMILMILFLFTTILFSGLFFIAKEEVSELKQLSESETVIEKATEEEVDSGVETRDKTIEIVEPVKQFLTITKDGRENMLYIEKLEEAKKYLSEDVYKQLSPKMSEEQIEQLKNEEFESDFTYSVDELRTAIRRTAIGYQVYATYTYTVQNKGKFHTSTDYLMIADVEKNDDEYVVSKIRRESVLQEDFVRE